MSKAYDLVVLGGGSAGLVATLGAAGLGARVALVEKRKLGGDCLHYGCVPSKALIRAAHAARETLQASRFGVRTGPVEVDFQAAMDHVRRAVAAVGVHDRPETFEAMGAEVFFGSPQFLRPGRIGLGSRVLPYRNCLLATGSRCAVPALAGLEPADYLTNETLFDLRERPRRLLVLGGGPIGCEMAQAMARLGSEVTLVHRRDRLLPREDPKASEVIEKAFRAEGIHLHLNCQAVEVRGGKALLSNGIRVAFDRILLATGRRGNTEGLNLQAVGIGVDERGFVRVDERLRTGAPGVWAAGDVHGRYLFTHTAEHEARYVLLQALFRIPLRPPYRVVPWTTFTDPEVARVGLTGAEARQRGLRHEVWRFPLAEVDRAVAEGRSEGYYEIVTGPRGEILGATIVAPAAGEMIHEVVLAMEKRLKASDLSRAIHVYPTFSYGTRRAADAWTVDHLVPRWVVRLAQFLFGYDTGRSVSQATRPGGPGGA